MKIFNTQSEYNQFYDRIKRYANQIAPRYFNDIGLRSEAIDKSLDEVTNQLIKNEKIDDIELYSKGIIRNSLKQSFRGKKVDSIPQKDSDIKIPEDALRLRKLVSNKKMPKVKLLGIENEKERRICLDYWQYGLTTKEIASKMHLKVRRIQQIISKYSI